MKISKKYQKTIVIHNTCTGNPDKAVKILTKKCLTLAQSYV